MKKEEKIMKIGKKCAETEKRKFQFLEKKFKM